MKKKIKQNYKHKWYFLIPLMFIIAVVPLIVFLKIVPLSGDALNYWTGQNEDYDFFTYYKMVWFLVSSFFVILVLAYKIYKDKGIKIKNYIYYIPMMIYSLFVILSTLFSKNGDIALLGFPSRYEGMFVLLSYMVLLLAATNLISDEKHIKAILWSLFASASIIGIIGMFQYIGYDIFKTNFGRNLIIPYDYASMADKIKFNLGEHSIYATLYHYDYVGSYMAMLLPLTLATFIFLKNRKYKITFGLLTLLIAVNWISCNSRAGILGGIVAITVFLIMINKYLIKYWKFLTIGVVAVAIIFVGLNKISHGSLVGRIASLINDTKSVTQKSAKKDANYDIPLKDVLVNGKNASIITKTETLNISLSDNGDIYFKDVEGRDIPINIDKKGIIHIVDDRYKDYTAFFVKTINDKNVLEVVKTPIILYFGIKPNEFELVDNSGKPLQLKPVEKWGFEGKELLGSSRGYIWSRSIPLLKHTILLGYGPDTFAIHFPQYDIKGKMYAYSGDMWQLVDKPHDLYLQIGINTGIISLLAVMMIFGVYLFSSSRIYFNRDYNNFTEIAGLGIFTAVCGYLTAAFFNDSVVSVAPVFWVLLGMGIAINGIVKKKATPLYPLS